MTNIFTTFGSGTKSLDSRLEHSEEGEDGADIAYCFAYIAVYIVLGVILPSAIVFLTMYEITF